MPFSHETLVPFRLKLLLAMLLAAGAGTWLTYKGFKSELKPFTNEAAGELLLSKLELRASLIDSELRAGLEKARLSASCTSLREMLAKHNLYGPGADRSGLKKALLEAAGATQFAGLDLAGADGKIVASLDPGKLGSILPGRPVPGERRVSPPRQENSYIVWDVTTPVMPPPGGGNVPLGALRCRFRLSQREALGLEPGKTPALTLALAARGGQSLLLVEAAGPREAALRSADGAPFLSALAGKTGVEFASEGEPESDIFAWRPLGEADWVLAGRAPLKEFSAGAGELVSRARRRALLGFIFLAAAAFLAAGALTARLAEGGRQAAALLEECGISGDEKKLSEPEALAGALGEAAAQLRRQSSRDLELEAEAEKLKEEEAGLKSQNDELEKLNKYLMERESKISELKQEIAELREKVGGGA